MSLIRLDKFLSSQLNISRSDSKKLIKKGAVTVDGFVAKKADDSIETERCTVIVSGKEIKYKEFIYLMLNKPKGIVSSTNDNRDMTVIDLVPDEFKRNGLFPAGRLDKDTTGFVLITDNGDFAHNILSPSHHVKKTYLVEVARKLTDDELYDFRNGMTVGDEWFKPSEINLFGVNKSNNNYIYEIKIVEGRYHQIKRMFASKGNYVLELKRIAIGGLFLDEELLPGELRELTDYEVDLIHKWIFIL